jgi:hypothetical protein
MKLDSKYILKIFIMVFLIFALIVFVNYIGLNLNENNTSKKLLQVVTLEGLTNSELDTNIIMNKSDAFCESNRGSSGTLDDSCGKLTQDNCNTTSCCVWTSNNKCMAGTASGPTFNSDANGKTKDLDYYYFQNKCYGQKCEV